MIRMIARWFRRQQRATDLSVLWPACKDLTTSMAEARAVFYLHASRDRAWTLDYDEESLMEFIARLN